MDYTFFSQLASEVEIPEDGTLSRTLYNDDQIKAIIFAFSEGQELSEHTASMPAIIHILEGDARLMLGEDSKSAQAGTWVHMPANLPHSVYAETPLTMFLLLLKNS